MTLTQVLRTANAFHGYWQAGDQVLLAVSGGVDSMALLHAMQQLPFNERPEMTVLHIHHHLRTEAEKDYQLVHNYCEEHHLKLEVKHWTEHPESNIEAAARAFRYEFFKEQMATTNSKLLLTAHHADDQMETILMRLARGSTLPGYAGIQRIRSFATGHLVRPLLAFEKKELYAYCAEHAVPFREDESNFSSDYTRNRFRNTIVPLLKQENEQAARHFGEFSDELSDLLSVATPVIKEASKQLFQKNGKDWVLSIQAFLEQPPAMQRLVLSYFLTNVWEATTQRQHTQQLLDLMVAGKPQAEIALIGGTVQRRYDLITFKLTETAKLNKLQFNQELELNKWLELPFNGKIGLFLSSTYASENGTIARLKAEEVVLPLIVRNWQHGDAIQLNKKQPFTKKIARIFIDNKIPNEDRDQAWVVTDYSGKILLVPGYATSIWLHEIGDYDLKK
ncbi:MULTISPECIES: tRNA lysidine(34) synthetase TilS [unclassified Jeotgalibaca]|uniref:tRNA lysidine(34) synthetase TilS n=1 Tax=unclassified Jeotgalibaca TaxID=2621505 RepID=UPI003FD15107